MAAIPAVEQVFKEWDIKRTDVLLEKLEADKNRRQEEEKKLKEAESNRFVHVVRTTHKLDWMDADQSTMTL